MRAINNSRPSVMIVEDSIITARLFEHYINKEGIETVTAIDGLDALEILEEYTPDMIVLDIYMPRLDGIETLKRIKKIARLRDIPVIILSSSDERMLIIESISLGAHDYIKKPLSEKVFIKKITFLLEYNKKIKLLNYLESKYSNVVLR